MSFFDPYAMDHEDEDLHSCCGSVEEPPFALVDAPTTTSQEQKHQQQQPAFSSQLSDGPQMLGSFLMNKVTDLVSPCASQETGKTSMGSSILYSPMSQSHTNIANSGGTIDSGHHNDLPEQFMDDDFDEFDAAASLLAESPMLGRSSHFMERGFESEAKADGGSPRDSMAFSDLMQEADDQIMHPPYRLAMPTLPEGREMRTANSIPISGGAASTSLTPRLTTDRSLLGLFVSTDFSSSSRSKQGSTNSLFQKRGIESCRVDQDTFEVSMHIYSSCAAQDIMDVIGNPDLLRLWCEPVRTLIVTRSSEGSRSATNRKEQTTGREYDGEWIEATTSTLSSPHKHASKAYQLGQYIWSHLGFPSYGKITMFVERQRGQVGLTMGPFAGNLTAFHTISIIECDGFVKIVDRVRVARDEEDHSSLVCCCGLCDVMQRCFMPKLDGHIEQSVASLTRLRVMIENGQSALLDYEPPPDLIVEGEEEGVSRVPLLS
eukprot:CAMPEP_0119005658 /NCGR_PEP_ID=MMETSP1176-20130426/1851_1 /TAXON_ID=265551 /ORGANISM="Synedropsis recta cf, Strain CCMP1620" /LENGTH=488 /DNA_ID=CAMNT_0006957493 /DNA_START=62 /DNA_END=1528 /DNA_ORIENTATION=+